MRIHVTCPFCARKGTLPEAMRGQRVKCAGCHQPFLVAAPKFGPKQSTETLAAMLEEDRAAAVRPLPLASTRRSVQPELARATSPAAYAAIGIGGVCALLLAMVALRPVVKPTDTPQFEGKQAVIIPPDPTPEPPPAPRPIPSEDERAAATAQRKKVIEDATVYLKLSRQGRLIGGGTGFVIGVEQDAVILATNRHVADSRRTMAERPTSRRFSAAGRERSSRNLCRRRSWRSITRAS